MLKDSLSRGIALEQSPRFWRKNFLIVVHQASGPKPRPGSWPCSACSKHSVDVWGRFSWAVSICSSAAWLGHPVEGTDYFFGTSSSLSSLFVEEMTTRAPEAQGFSRTPLSQLWKWLTYPWPMALRESGGTEVSLARLTLSAVLLVSAIPIGFSELFSEAFERKERPFSMSKLRIRPQKKTNIT